MAEETVNKKAAKRAEKKASKEAAKEAKKRQKMKIMQNRGLRKKRLPEARS